VNAPKRRNGSSSRRRPAPREVATDFWHAQAPLPELEPITPTQEPTTLLQSLGELPINDDTGVRYQLASVVDRAAQLANVLALAANLVDQRT
jgi:hypothetical protein